MFLTADFQEASLIQLSRRHAASQTHSACTRKNWWWLVSEFKFSTALGWTQIWVQRFPVQLFLQFVFNWLFYMHTRGRFLCKVLDISKSIFFLMQKISPLLLWTLMFLKVLQLWIFLFYILQDILISFGCAGGLRMFVTANRKETESLQLRICLITFCCAHGESRFFNPFEFDARAGQFCMKI